MSRVVEKALNICTEDVNLIDLLAAKLRKVSRKEERDTMHIQWNIIGASSSRLTLCSIQLQLGEKNVAVSQMTHLWHKSVCVTQLRSNFRANYDIFVRITGFTMLLCHIGICITIEERKLFIYSVQFFYLTHLSFKMSLL